MSEKLKKNLLNRTKRLIKMPKLYFGDTGLLINQLRVGRELILEEGRLLGLILENFVFLELKKLSTWSISPIDFYHYRTQTGIEVKASETITADDWKGLHFLNEEMGDKMVRRIILYPGKEVVVSKKNCLAIPIKTLWDCG